MHATGGYLTIHVKFVRAGYHCSATSPTHKHLISLTWADDMRFCFALRSQASAAHGTRRLATAVDKEGRPGKGVWQLRVGVLREMVGC